MDGSGASWDGIIKAGLDVDFSTDRHQGLYAIFLDYLANDINEWYGGSPVAFKRFFTRMFHGHLSDSYREPNVRTPGNGRCRYCVASLRIFLSSGLTARSLGHIG